MSFPHNCLNIIDTVIYFTGVFGRVIQHDKNM